MSNGHDVCRAVIWISSCWVFAIIRQGIEQLEMCFTFIFLLFPEKWKERSMLILAGGIPGPSPLSHPCLSILFSHALVRETFWMLLKFHLIELGTIRWLKNYHTLSWQFWTHPRCMIIGSSRRKFFDPLLSSTYLPLYNAELIFQSAIETLIRVCRHPPRPDAVCRYQNCSNKAQIYLTDPGRCFVF